MIFTIPSRKFMSAETSHSSDDAVATSPCPRLLRITRLQRRRGAMSERRRGTTSQWRRGAISQRHHQNYRRDVTATPIVTIYDVAAISRCDIVATSSKSSATSWCDTAATLPKSSPRPPIVTISQRRRQNRRQEVPPMKSIILIKF